MAISLELFLGILGTVTGLMGAASLFIHILRYFREKPKIEAELQEAKHHYSSRGENEKNYFLTFITDSLVRNTGDRGTTIGYAELSFSIGKQQHTLSERSVLLQANRQARLGPNDMATLRVSFQLLSSYDVHPEQKEIPFELTLYHTHGETKLHGVSNIIVK